jgi:4,5-dihydroxyphthalate decarboxylase
MTTSTGTLTLKTALGSYGHVAALKDGSIKPDGVEFDYVDVAPIINAFRRMCRQLEFDVSEMAITTYITAKAYGLPFTAIPVFPVRAFHHGAWVYNTKAGISGPKDLEGKKVGMRAYTVTTGVWARGILASEYGVDMSKVTCVLADEEHVDAFHKDAPPMAQYNLGADLAKMLLEGELAAGVGVGRLESEDIKPLIPNARAVDADAYQKTGIYPINHMVVVKDSLLAEHPTLAVRLFEAFKAAKEHWLKNASDDDKKAAGHNIVTGDPLPYGVEANRPALETIAAYALDQKILPRKFELSELFAKGTMELK